jgi:hypothetical protein
MPRLIALAIVFLTFGLFGGNGVIWLAVLSVSAHIIYRWRKGHWFGEY